MGTPPPPLKIKILKIGLCSDLSWPKLGLEPKCHDPWTFGEQCQIFKMAAAATLDSDLFVKGGARHHPYLIINGSKEP